MDPAPVSAIDEEERVRNQFRPKEVTYPTHKIYCRLSQFVLQVVSFDETNAMFTGHGALHLNGSLHHAMDDSLCSFLLRVIPQDDSCQRLDISGICAP